MVSGTLYLVFPKGARAIKFEDPRLGLMMAAPPRKSKARPSNQTFVSAEPAAGTLLLWESWLRHEVPLNAADSERKCNCVICFKILINRWLWRDILRLQNRFGPRDAATQNEIGCRLDRRQ